MDALSSIPSDPGFASASLQTSKMVVLQPCGNLDCATSTALQHALEQALQQDVTAVVVDLIQVTAIAFQGIQVLQAALKLAIASGKELVVWAADAATYTALKQERDRQQARQLSDYPEGGTASHRTETVHPGFSHFLNNCRHAVPAPSSVVLTAKPLLKAVSTTPTMAADPYTVANWHPANLLDDIA